MKGINSSEECVGGSLFRSGRGGAWCLVATLVDATAPARHQCKETVCEHSQAGVGDPHIHGESTSTLMEFQNVTRKSVQAQGGLRSTQTPQ